jgi:hypothetical protein
MHDLLQLSSASSAALKILFNCSQLFFSCFQDL